MKIGDYSCPRVNLRTYAFRRRTSQFRRELRLNIFCNNLLSDIIAWSTSTFLQQFAYRYSSTILTLSVNHIHFSVSH